MERRPRRSALHPATLLPAALALLAALEAGAARPPAATRLPRATAALPRSSPRLPDTVLAVVNGNRRITRSEFLAAWNRLTPPSRPDTLTPETGREFLELLVGREALAARALRERFTWTREESLRYRALRDRLTLDAALDSALREVQGRLLAAGDTVTDREALGVAARDSFAARLGLEWNEPAVARLAARFDSLPRPSRDSSLMVQIRVLGASPRLDAAGRAEVLVRGGGDPFTAHELVEAWNRLNPLQRPRIATADQVRDLARNALFERALRRAAERGGLERRPDIARALEREREFYAVESYVGREVYARIDTTLDALRRWYQPREAEFALPTRALVTRLTLPDRRAANEIAVRLASEAEAETLAARAARQGLRYRGEISAVTDSALFERALRAGPGAVVGPDSAAAGWTVARVHLVHPARPRTFDEARVLAANRYYGEEGERLMVALLDRLRKEARVTVNPRGLDFIKSRSSPGAGS